METNQRTCFFFLTFYVASLHIHNGHKKKEKRKKIIGKFGPKAFERSKTGISCPRAAVHERHAGSPDLTVIFFFLLLLFAFDISERARQLGAFLFFFFFAVAFVCDSRGILNSTTRLNKGRNTISLCSTN